MSKREDYIDVLKAIGLLCIILAHVKPPNIIFQLRNFDVILMIMISSYLGIKSYKNKTTLNYYIKRFKRLVLPTWIFLVFFFTVFKTSAISYEKVLNSFALDEGIGYVWIIRIYFLISLLIPLCQNIIRKYKKKNVIITTLLFYIIYEVCCYNGLFNNKIMLYLFAYIVPCYLLIIISYYIFDNKKMQIITFVISMLVFIVIELLIYKENGCFLATQTQKYPFRVLYLSYAISASSLIILLFRNWDNNHYSDGIIKFISSHSLWIYLWHIMIIYKINSYSINWIIKYIIVITLATIVTYFQSLLIKRLENIINKNILDLFRG